MGATVVAALCEQRRHYHICVFVCFVNCTCLRSRGGLQFCLRPLPPRHFPLSRCTDWGEDVLHNPCIYSRCTDWGEDKQQQQQQRSHQHHHHQHHQHHRHHHRNWHRHQHRRNSTQGPDAVTATPPSRPQDLRGGRRLHPALVSKWIMLDLEHANFAHTLSHTHTTTRRSCLLGFSIELATYKNLNPRTAVRSKSMGRNLGARRWQFRWLEPVVSLGREEPYAHLYPAAALRVPRCLLASRHCT